MQTSVAKIWIKLEVCVRTRPRGAWNKFCALFPASCVCNGPPKLRYWACQSVTMAMHGCSWAEVVFLTCAALRRQHVVCASERDSITLTGPVSPRTLNVAWIHNNTDKVQSSTDCALCLPPAVITRSDVTVETGAGSTNTRTGAQNNYLQILYITCVSPTVSRHLKCDLNSLRLHFHIPWCIGPCSDMVVMPNPTSLILGSLSG